MRIIWVAQLVELLLSTAASRGSIPIAWMWDGYGRQVVQDVFPGLSDTRTFQGFYQNRSHLSTKDGCTQYTSACCVYRVGLQS